MKDGCPSDGYPYNVPCRAPITKEKILEALEKGMHGRCVYRCDNDVVDHQITQMRFENGVKATLTMTAFTRHCGRRMDFYGTLGQITLDEVRDVIYIGVFGKGEVVLKISDLVDDRYTHGGGDYHLINNLYEMLMGSAPEKTALGYSAESHLIGIAAEQSRLQKGKLVQVH
jgi:predicted dehydrogenase